MKHLKKRKWSYVILTLLVMALGICLMIWPGISATVLCNLCGGVLLIVGSVRIVCYFQRGISALWHRYELPLGLLDALLGGYFFSHPANVLLLLPVIVGIVIITNSVCKLQTALEIRSLGVKNWWTMLLLSVFSILVAIYLIRNPFEGTMTLMIYLGLCLVIDSIQGLVFIHNVAADVRRTAPVDAEVIEAAW